jgi:hypothetical protein
VGELRAAVVTSLNGGSFSQQFTAVQRGIARWTVEELESLKVTVVSGPATFQAMGRPGDRKDLTTDIVVQKGDVDPADPSSWDAYLELMEELVEHFKKTVLTTAGGAKVQSGAREFVNPGSAAVWPQHLENYNTFTGVVRVAWLWRPSG